MADRGTIARPYAKAAFAPARRPARSSTAGPGAAGSRAPPPLAISACAALFGNPRVTPAQLAELVMAMAGEALSDQERNFMRVLAENNRLPSDPPRDRAAVPGHEG